MIIHILFFVKFYLIHPMTNISFQSPSVCKNFLAGMCPKYYFHEIDSSEKNGNVKKCELMHIEELRVEYLSVRRPKLYGYEEKCIQELSKHVNEANRKISNARGRLLKIDPDCEWSKKFDEIAGLQDAVLAHIKAIYAEASKDPENAKNLLNTAIGLKREQTLREFELSQLTKKTFGQTNNIAVCEICGAVVQIGDPDHFTNKLHLGYEKMRVTLEELTKFLAAKDKR